MILKLGIMILAGPLATYLSSKVTAVMIERDVFLHKVSLVDDIRLTG